MLPHEWIPLHDSEEQISPCSSSQHCPTTWEGYGDQLRQVHMSQAACRQFLAISGVKTTILSSHLIMEKHKYAFLGLCTFEWLWSASFKVRFSVLSQLAVLAPGVTASTIEVFRLYSQQCQTLWIKPYCRLEASWTSMQHVWACFGQLGL
jgi:hypothetical protein